MTKRLRAMYFTGTGTTARVTSAIAEHLWQRFDNKEETAGVIGQTGDLVDYAKLPACNWTKLPDINFSALSARQKLYTFDTDDIVIFGVPVIAGRVPNVLLGFLDTLQGGGAIAIPVVLYGNRNYDDALIELRNILEKQGFHTAAAAAFIGEHSFSDVLAAGRPDADDMKIAEDFAEAAAEKILAMTDSGLENVTHVQVRGCESLRPYYKPQDRNGNHINILKVKPKLDAALCMKCGICVSACPMGSIKPEALGLVDGICIKCCGCIKKCPQRALYFDDPGYIYHKEELEEMYGGVRKEPELFI